MVGQKISPILSEIESTLWEFESRSGFKPEYTIEGFRAATKIFMSAMMDKIWELQSKEEIDMNTRGEMAKKCGEDIRRIVKVYTDIDTYDLYK
ncbi:MAG TPA: hypothetical protein VIQ23_11255 [Hanamia sp.]